jgi:DNA polymerase III alpha subunit (gram-positive type)
LTNYPEKYIIFDIETTGFSGKTDKVTEIGAIKIVDDKVISEFNVMFNWDIEIPKKITELTTITKQMLDENGIEPLKAINEFLEYIGTDIPLIGHNVIRFDIPFLIGNFEALAKLKLHERVVDTAAEYKASKIKAQRKAGELHHQFANRILSHQHYGVKYSIDTACVEFNIDKSKITRHRAVGDCYLTKEIYKNVCLNQLKKTKN